MGDPQAVVVVGGSVAGCATAALLGRAGARVTVLEKAPSPEHFKRMCSHFIQPSALPVLERLGLLDDLATLDAVPNPLNVWTRGGWYHTRGAEGLNIRRAKLDPLLRRTAAATDGVEVRQGTTVTALVRDAAGRPAGVRVRDKAGHETECRARVVVAADGRGSGVARMAGVRGRVLPHERIGSFAYYEGLEMETGTESVSWFTGPRVLYVFPNDDGLTVVAAFVPRGHGAAFKADPAAALERSFDGLPRRPDFRRARRVGSVLGKLELPNVHRRAAVDGLAFVGDAAQASDPVWGVGVGFALQSAGWLADALASALGSDHEADAALRRYRRRHVYMLYGHHMQMSDFARERELNAFERFMFKAATHHEPTAEMMSEMAGRMAPMHTVLTPPRLARAAVAAARHRLAA